MDNDIIINIMNGDFGKIKKLVASNRSNINIKDNYGRTLLMEAIIFNKEEIVKYLIENGANVNEQDKNGWSALHFAVQAFSVSSVKSLLEHNAEVDLQDIYGNTPLSKALVNSAGRGDIITMLLDAGADSHIKNKSGISPYELAHQIDNFDYKRYFN